VDQKITAADFSRHLFWDVDVHAVDLQKNRNWLIRRVLEKGLMKDWELLQQVYDKDQLRSAVKALRSLEKKATSFACAVLDLEQTELRCYKNRQSQNPPWPY
jgi:uncharacterized protein (DUF2461 family)